MSENKERGLLLDKYVQFRNFKLKRVVLLVSVDDNSCSEKAPGIDINDAYLEKNKVETVEGLKIASLNELWSVTLPYGNSMYHFICDLYSFGDESTDELLFTMLCNMNCSTTICHGVYTKLIECCNYAYLTLVSVPDAKKRGKEYISIASKMLSLMELGEAIDYTDLYKSDSVLDESSEIADGLRSSYKSDGI